MNLHDVFAIQKTLALELIDFENVEETTIDLCMATIAEVVELRDELNWKKWSKEKKIVNQEAVLYEIVDIFAFAIELAILWNLDANDLMQYYKNKMAINYKKYLGRDLDAI